MWKNRQQLGVAGRVLSSLDGGSLVRECQAFVMAYPNIGKMSTGL